MNGERREAEEDSQTRTSQSEQIGENLFSDCRKHMRFVRSSSSRHELLKFLSVIVSDDDEIDYSSKPEFYDPKLDDNDEVWAQKQRRGRISDAVLSCPACFTTLCLDCQR